MSEINPVIIFICLLPLLALAFIWSMATENKTKKGNEK